jgi:hypothetical protein
MDGTDCGLHPLIHTPFSKSLAQNVAGNPKQQKCELKYVIFVPRHQSGVWILTLRYNLPLGFKKKRQGLYYVPCLEKKII